MKRASGFSVCGRGRRKGNLQLLKDAIPVRWSREKEVGGVRALLINCYVRLDRKRTNCVCVKVKTEL
jgi:hypothetical protein